MSEQATHDLQINGSAHRVEAEPDMPLLWVLRDLIGLVGTKFGCGIGQCGACTVHIDGTPARSCLTPVAAAAGRAITTIEGLAAPSGGLHALQDAWIEMSVPQCGYCQSGQLMSAAALLAGTPEPTDADIDRAMAGNLCRCGTYPRIRGAIHRAAARLRETSR
jgi:isoquinoline 1-oxidoreductase subunit alpha